MRKQKSKVLVAASVASMIDQFNMQNLCLLLEMGYEVHVACNFKQGNTCDAKRIEKLCSTLERMQVVKHQWDCPRGLGSVADCMAAYRQLQSLTARYSFVWMHCHSPMGGALARLIAHSRKIRVVYTAHGFHFYKGAPIKNWLLYYPVEKLLARWTDVLITVNTQDRRLAERRLCAGKVFCMPGVGIDTEKFGQVTSSIENRSFRKKHGIPKDSLILLSVGELSRRKNHLEVLRALPKLTEKNVYYIICGQGPLHRTLLREAEKLGVQNRVKLTGYSEQVEVFYRNADVFVFPSIQEGLPAALMEAMAAGLPCVVSDIRGNRELIGKNFRFSLGKPEQMVPILNRLLSDLPYSRKQGRRNRKKAGNYSRTAVEKNMREVYEYMQAGEDCGCEKI